MWLSQVSRVSWIFGRASASRRHAVKRSTAALAALATLAAVGLAACGVGGPQFALQNVSGLLPQLKFALTNDDGQMVTAKDYRGKIVLLYFGYTHCPDACPTTLTNLSEAMKRLGPEASRVRVLFVTVDPARDTLAVLKRYVSAFGPEFVGLRGDDDALTALSKRYRIAYHREPPDRNGYYAVDHSSAVFIFDASGAARLLAGESDNPRTIAVDLHKLDAS
ncbi:MAG TPA: SCO family protein [Steroidobacteraceae bacterium]|nr:SCO family protein [Steroidobacteraceae bacterium]